MKRKSAVFVFTVLLSMSCAACASAGSPADSTQGLTAWEEDLADASGDGHASQSSREDQEPEVYSVDVPYAKQENLLPMQDTVTMEGISYQILSCEVTKEFGERNRETLADYLGDRMDSQANLTGDETYIFVKMCITNHTEESVKICRVPGYVAGIESNLEVLPLGESVYIDEYWTEGEASEVNFYLLKPGESVESESGYLVMDNDLAAEGRTLYYEISHTSDPGDPENKYIKLEN